MCLYTAVTCPVGCFLNAFSDLISIYSQAMNSPQTGYCSTGYTLQNGSLNNFVTCAGTAASGYCVLPKAEAHSFCNADPECSGVSETSNAGWLSAYPGMVSPGKLPISENFEWKTCVKARVSV